LEAALSPENLRNLLKQALQGGEVSTQQLQGSPSLDLKDVRADVSALKSSVSVDSFGMLSLHIGLTFDSSVQKI
jgi:hypothetical protein